MSSVIRIESFPEANGPRIASLIARYTGMYAVDELLEKLPVEFEVKAENFETLRGHLEQLGCNQKFISIETHAEQLLSPEDQAIVALPRGEVITRSIRLYWQDFRLFLGLGSIFWLPIMAGSSLPYIEHPTYKVVYTLAAMITFFFLMHVAYVLVLVASSERILGREVGLLNTINRVGISEFFRFAWAKILMYLVTSLGYLLLVIPGIIWSIRLAVSGPVAAIEGKTGKAALRRSSQLARGHGGIIFGTLFGMGFLIGGASLLISLVLTLLGQQWGADKKSAKGFADLIAYTITTPLMAITMVTLYYHLLTVSLREKVRIESQDPRIEAPGPDVTGPQIMADERMPESDYKGLRREEEAVKTLKKRIHQRPNDAEVHFDLGAFYSELELYEEATVALKEAIRLRPYHARAYTCLGYIYIVLGRYEDAKGASTEAIRLKPNNVEAHYYLGLAYVGLGKREGAQAEYEILKGLDRETADELFGVIYKD